MEHISKLFLENPECLKIALNSIGDALIVTNLEGKVVFLNSVALELSKYNNSEYIGQYINQAIKIINIETREEVNITSDWADDLICIPANTILVSPDGTERITENIITPIKRASGEIFAAIMVFHDITNHKEAEKIFRRQSAAIKASMDGMAILNQKGRIVYINDALLKIYGYELAEEILGKSWSVFYNKREYERGKKEIIPLFSENGHWRGEIIGKRRNGTTFPKEISLSLIEGDGIVYVVRDITNRKQAEEALRYQSYHDPLTSLPNRMLFTDRLNMALTYAQRNNAKLAVLFLDLDNYNYINDVLGHTMGDQLILGISERLITTLWNDVTVGRLSGDEFSILLPEIAEVEEAAKVAQKILDELRKPWIIDGQEFYITASIGIAIYPNDGDDAQFLLKNADLAMSRAKERKDSYQLYTPMMNIEAMERLALERELRKALEKNELIVYYQPQIDVKDGRIIGMEALVRWNHPRRGLVLPMQFIPMAEATGLIIPLGEWVLYTACSQNKEWQKAGFPPMRVSVNLSASQFKQKNILDMVAKVLKATGLESKWLQLEITETAAMQDVEYTVKTLRVLKNMGIQLAIDDFGTGYSSLSYLKRFPISTLKIDRSFVNDINDKDDNSAILASIIFLAHNLNLNVIAEGVETIEQLDFLKERCCQEIQGYLFSKPVPADQFINLVLQNNNG